MKLHSVGRITGLLGVVTLLAACSSIPPKQREQAERARIEAYAGQPVDHFTWLGRYDGWKALSRDEAGVWTTRDKAYLIKVAQPCEDHTPRSRALQAIRSSIMVQRIALQSGLCLGEAMRTGKTGFEVCFGKPAFEYLAANPEQADYFAQRMSQITVYDEPLILAQLEFQPFRLAVDIGGSHGTLLLGLLAKYPDARGIVFDLPDVAARAAERLSSRPQGNRIEAVGGDFLRSVPAGGDLYLMKQILHNWDDDQCIAILKSVRTAIVRPAGLQ